MYVARCETEVLALTLQLIQPSHEVQVYDLVTSPREVPFSLLPPIRYRIASRLVDVSRADRRSLWNHHYGKRSSVQSLSFASLNVGA